jgi:tetratricopeptide (TPR) repeat protein
MLTDHRIVRTKPLARVGRLIEFGDGALSADPKDPDVLTRLGYLYQTQGDLERAERLYSRAFEQDPSRAVAAANLGVFYANRGMLIVPSNAPDAQGLQPRQRAIEHHEFMRPIGNGQLVLVQRQRPCAATALLRIQGAPQL